MKTEIDESFEVSDKLRKWAGEEVPQVEIDRETGRFVDHHLARGNQFKDWDAAWRNWMRRAPEWGGYLKATGSRGMPKEITEEERAEDKRKADIELANYLRIVK